jgi:ubiquinone/menaquinone biosynthesis C-methylase UbiE
MATVAATETGTRYKRRTLELLGAHGGHVVADLGCGPGTDLAALAALTNEAGGVLGVDSSPSMLARAAGLGLPTTVGLVRADLHAVPLASASVDRVRTDRVLQHVHDPVAVLREVARLLRPGGVAVFAEPDWATLTIDSPVREGSEQFRRQVVRHQVRNASIGSALPRLGAAAGLATTRVEAHTATFTEHHTADVVLGLTRVAERAVTDGVMTRELSRAWLESLNQPPFTAAVTIFLVRLEV